MIRLVRHHATLRPGSGVVVLRAWIVIAAVAGVIAAVVPRPVEASAGEVAAVGWWSRLPTASAPSGGFAVGAGPDGPTTVAAVRVDLGANGMSRFVLQATETGGTGADLLDVLACPAVDSWTATAAGDFAAAPAIDCATASVPFRRAPDGTWSADLTALVAGKTGLLSVGLQPPPAGTANALGAAPAEVRYDRPAVSGDALTPPTTAPSALTPSSTPTPPATSPPGASAAPTGSGRLPEPMSRPATPGPVAQTAGPEQPPATLPSTTVATIASPTAAASNDDGDGRPIKEAFFLVFLSALVGLAVGGGSKLLAGRDLLTA